MMLSNEKGLTLLEVIISIAILGIIVVSFLTMFSFGYGQIFSMGNKTEASRIAQDYVDMYYSGELTNTTTQSVKFYQVDSTIDPYNHEGMTLNKVTVTVSYKNGDESVKLEGIIP